MPTKVGVSVHQPDNSHEKSLVERAREDGKIGEEDFGFLFTSTEFDFRELVNKVDEGIQSEWVGGTTVAEISPEGYSEGTAVLMLVESSEVVFESVESQELGAEAEDAARQATQDIQKHIDNSYENRLLFTLLPGFTQSDEGREFKFLKGLESEIEEDISVVGGSTGDGLELRENYQIRNGEIYPNRGVITLIRTDLPIVTGQSHGFKESVATGVVTEAEGRILKEVKGEPAAQFYADAVGADVKEISKLFDLPFKEKLLSAIRYSVLKLKGEDPLMMHKILNYSHSYSIGREVGNGEYRIISPVSVQDGGIKLLDDIREGQLVHVLQADDKDIREAGKNAFADLDSDQVVFSLLTTCANRYLMLEEDEKEQEIEMISDKLGKNFAGFYGEGEIGDGGIGLCTFVNQTVTGFAVKKE